MDLQELLSISTCDNRGGTLGSRGHVLAALVLILMHLIDLLHNRFNFHIQTRQVVGEGRKHADQNESWQIEKQSDQYVKWRVII